MYSHAMKEHEGRIDFRCRILKVHKSAFERQVTEAVYIKMLKRKPRIY